jgi:plastocyanin
MNHRRSLSQMARALAAIAALSAATIGCGGDDDSSSDASGGASAETTSETTSAAEAPPGGSTLDLPADASGSLKYAQDSVSASAGKVTVSMDNPSPLDHDIAIEGNGVEEKGEVVGKGGVSKFTADLKPGTYTLFCSVPGHREGGMEATLTVK